eukprot:4034049-Ditylum_brightwellii.AAC.1
MPEQKSLSRNAIFSSHFLLKQKTVNQQQLLILDNCQNPNVYPTSGLSEKRAGGRAVSKQQSTNGEKKAMHHGKRAKRKQQ